MKREIIEKIFGETWVDFMTPFVQSDQFKEILDFLKKEKAAKKTIFPDQAQVFRCFKELPLPDVRVVVLGQDPYPIAEYANGLAFAHSIKKKIAPSLNSMLDCIEKDMYNGLDFDKNNFDTELTDWVKQGVLLMNASFTVEEKKAGEHLEIWKPFTKYVIETLGEVRRNLVMLGWGKPASVFLEAIHFAKHFTFIAEHPSNAAQNKRAWDCKHFSLANAVIIGNKLGEPIKW